MTWLGEREFPDSAYDQEVTFEGCLAVFNIPENPHTKYMEQLSKAIGDAYAANLLVFFLYDNDKPIEPPAEWVDVMEHSYAMGPLQVVCKGYEKAILPFLPEERQAILRKMGEQILNCNRVKIIRKKFQAIGSVTIDGKQVLLPLTEVSFANANG